MPFIIRALVKVFLRRAVRKLIPILIAEMSRNKKRNGGG